MNSNSIIIDNLPRDIILYIIKFCPVIEKVRLLNRHFKEIVDTFLFIQPNDELKKLFPYFKSVIEDSNSTSHKIPRELFKKLIKELHAKAKELGCDIDLPSDIKIMSWELANFRKLAQTVNNPLKANAIKKVRENRWAFRSLSRELQQDEDIVAVFQAHKTEYSYVNALHISHRDCVLKLSRWAFLHFDGRNYQ